MKPHTLKHIHYTTEAIYKEHDALYIIYYMAAPFPTGPEATPIGVVLGPSI